MAAQRKAKKKAAAKTGKGSGSASAAKRKATKKKPAAKPPTKKTAGKKSTRKAPQKSSKKTVAKTSSKPAEGKTARATREPAAGSGKRKKSPRPSKRGGGAKKGTPRRKPPPLDIALLETQLLAKQKDLLQAYHAAKGESRNRQSDGTEDYIDYAVSSYDREFLLSLSELEQRELMLVEEALKRIERDSFGRCVQCQRFVAAKRLEVQPWARYCLRCQEIAEQGLGQESFDAAIADDDDLDPERDEYDEDEDVDELEPKDSAIG